jgi:hypothetical protein
MLMSTNSAPAISVAALQMCSGEEREANLASAGRLLALAAARGAMPIGARWPRPMVPVQCRSFWRNRPAR